MRVSFWTPMASEVKVDVREAICRYL